MEEEDHVDDQTPEILDESSSELENTASLNSSVSEIEHLGMNLLLNWKTLLLSIPLCLILKHLGMNLLLN